MAIDVSKQVQKAEQAFQTKKYEMAIEIYLQALQIDPDNRAARRGIRLASLKKTENNYPSSLSIKLSTASTRVGMLHPTAEQRFPAYEAYLKVDPKNTDIGHQLAEALEKAGHQNGAIGVLEAIVEINPKDGQARTSLGRLLAGKEPQKALEHLEAALKIDPKNQLAIKTRKDLAAELSIKRAGFETARTTHDLIRDKDKARELNQADRLQRDASESGDHISRIEARVRQTPGDRKLLRELARAYASANRTADAENAWQKIIDSDPADFDAKVQLGDLRLGQIDRALAVAEQKGDRIAVDNLTRRRTEAQIAEFTMRVSEHPTDLGIRYQLGEALLRAGRLDEATGEFQKCVKDPRRRVDAMCLLGECFLQQGLHDLAARQLEKALEESPGLNSERGKAIVYTLGVLRESQGDRAAARDEYLKVYEVDVSFRDVAKKIAALSKPQ
ncbi:MAG: Beta-barrel assembly-enhancing protease [Planctomycetes bacterium]|nr:Beta-barrel assembly-enhancing protease [Planctomycetota bacterium]